MLRLVDIQKTYAAGGRPVPALRGVSLELAAGEFCAIVGPSGSGKTTLMGIAGLLERPSAGEVILEGEAVDFARADETAGRRNRTLGFVFQSHQLLPRLTAWENVALPLFYAGVPRPERRPMAEAALGEVGLAHRVAHRPGELSGGEAQRVALARALVRRPAVVLADEPTGSLDSANAAEVMDLLADLNARLGVTVLLVTHNPEAAARASRRVEILDGRIVADRSTA